MKIKESDLEKVQVNISKYCLINIKAFFIISYMYISVVNLISTTANNEATMDEEGESHFDITSQSQHHQLMVSRIDDPVLWNCRETSLTKNYYQILYIMLFVASGTATLLFFGVKTLNFCGDCPLKRLWEVAVAQHLKETHTNNDKRYTLDKTNEIIDCYQAIFNNKMADIKENITFSYRQLRTFAPILSTIYLIVGWWFLLLSYDLHPISCLSGPNEETIHYISEDSAVEIKYSPHVLRFQFAAVIIGAILLGAFVMNGTFFYAMNGLIINEMKENVQLKYEEAAKRLGWDLETTLVD